MFLRKTLIAAALAAIAGQALSSETMMAEFKGPASPQASASLLAKLVAKQTELGLDEQHGVALGKQHPGVAGTQIQRVQHTFAGVPIWGSESVVVTDEAGQIVSQSNADLRQGLGAPAASLDAKQGISNVSKASKPLNTTPSLSGQQAIKRVVMQLSPNGAHEQTPRAQLIIFPLIKQVRVPEAINKAEEDLNAFDVQDVVVGHELAYLVQTRMIHNGKLQFRDSIVQAHTGQVLRQWDAMHTVAGTGSSQYSGSVPVETTYANGVYKMLDSTRGVGGVFGGTAITNMNQQDVTPGTIYTNANNVWGDGKNFSGTSSTTSANGQTAAVEAMWGLRNTYDMMKNVVGWKSLDGKNTASYIGVHYLNAEDNAYYDNTCKCMKIGDGASMFKQLGSLDVIGHEMGHGVTDATSGLVYYGEAGGLNEAASDINGEMVEAYAKAGGTGTVLPASGNDWMMGKEISKTGTPLRWLYKPSKDGASKDAWSSTLGNLNPHYSSGPANRMFYFLAKGSSSSTTSDYYSKYLTKAPKAMIGIGLDKAYRIWFRANTTKFTSSTNYAKAQAACVQAATELYGASSKEVIAVKRAFAAINVGTDIAG